MSEQCERMIAGDGSVLKDEHRTAIARRYFAAGVASFEEASRVQLFQLSEKDREIERLNQWLAEIDPLALGHERYQAVVEAAQAVDALFGPEQILVTAEQRSALERLRSALPARDGVE